MDDLPESGTLEFWKPPPLGYGFLHAGGGVPDTFIHWSVLFAAGIDEIVLGTKLKFSVETGPDGRRRAKRCALAED